MYLKKLEVFGFKSFADKTVLNFEKGISAVVGPNGCGKSNVFDAIRWVLGEQSAKDLRGSSMEDVIFNGTDKKAPLGFAEVSLVFSNESRVLPLDHDEVMITRRLFRSGESEYLINKNASRLRDIVELFLGTGIGAEAYSMIQQGRVDMVVSAKPEDRRQIFDEAAGITKYKAKKKEALSKLKETEDNLLRLNDIVVEVKRQIATIERQAKKAQQYKEAFEQLKQYELVMTRHQMGQYAEEEKIINETLAGFAAKEADAARQLEELSYRMGHETSLLEELEERLSALKAQQIRLENEIDINVRQIAFNEERLSGFEVSQTRLQEDKKNALERCGVAQLKIEELKQSLNQLHQSALAAEGRLQEKRGALNALNASLAEAVESIKYFEGEIFSLNAQEVRVKNGLNDNMKRSMESLARKSRLEQENQKVYQEKDVIAQKLNGINAAIGELQTNLEAAWGACNARRSSLQGLKDQLSAQDKTFGDLEKAKVFLLSQKEFIEKMHVQYQDNPDPVVEGKFMATVRPSDNQTGIIGKIKNIEVIPASENQAERYEITYETKYIALDLQYMDERLISLDTQINAAIETKGQIAAEIKASEASVEEELRSIQSQERRLSVLEAQKNDTEAESGKIVGELEMLTLEFAEIEATLNELKGVENALTAQLDSIVHAVNVAQEDISQKKSSIAHKQQEAQELNVAIAQMDAEYGALAGQEKGISEQLAIFTANLDRDLADITRYDNELRDIAAKSVVAQEEMVQWQGIISTTKAKQEALSGELNDCSNQKSEMAVTLNSLRLQSRAIEDEIIEAKSKAHELQMKAQELQFNTRGIKERLLQVYKIEWDAFIAEASDVIARSPEGDEAISTEPAPQVNYDELAIEIEKLKKKCDSYGTVNLVAIEEFDELKNRHEFLTKQQSDLLTAREQLMSTIQKINRTTRQMFTDTFTKVNEEFKIHYKMLFGGGEAELVLVDPENALECGIDIIARPPGKKPQHISLLSGGEKTLTAIALIFGVFKVNPSPFCVLDEIDAALDENNVGRFAVMLKEFAKIAQFVVITHNKKTMASADVMYGVTQQERGVSRIVSVKFHEYQHPNTPAASQQSLPALASV